MKTQLFFVCAVLAAALPGRANVTLPSLFSEHAVLQKSSRVPVWGKADPGEAVTVTLDAAKATAKADEKGAWKAVLDLSTMGQGPFELIVEGKNRVAVPDVVVGEVWLCSGQSNMEFTLSRSENAAEEIAASANPMLRNFLVSRAITSGPSDTCKGAWVVASPQTSGTFTAVGYYFAKNLNRELKTPVGFIDSSWGGTPVEPWIGAEAFDKDPALKAKMDAAITEMQSYPDKLRDYVAQYHDWEKQYNRQQPQAAAPELFAAPGIPTADWKTVRLPGKFEDMPESGVIWLRRTVKVPGDDAKRNVGITLPVLNGFETVYWNGTKIGAMQLESGRVNSNRNYTIPAKLVEPGEEATIAIRLVLPAGGGEVPAGARFCVNFFKTAQLDGDWLAKAESELPPVTAEAKASLPQPPLPVAPPSCVATSLFNSMINPLIPYRIAGALWYQGESNAKDAFAYRTLLPLLITDWRSRWEEGDFPFYICQLANHMRSGNTFAADTWPVLRESQSKALALPNTGMAVLLDIGEEADIHPRNKRTVGERLAIIALAKNYGKPVPFSGPVYKSFAVEGAKIRVQFEHVEDGLEARTLPATYVPMSMRPAPVPLVRHSPQSQLEGFAICGPDQEWKWADAVIDGASVVVSSPDVPTPVAVRYAWANNPVCNLYNKAAFPAAPFRTDDFPVITQSGGQ